MVQKQILLGVVIVVVLLISVFVRIGQTVVLLTPVSVWAEQQILDRKEAKDRARELIQREITHEQASREAAEIRNYLQKESNREGFEITVRSLRAQGDPSKQKDLDEIERILRDMDAEKLRLDPSGKILQDHKKQQAEFDAKIRAR